MMLPFRRFCGLAILVVLGLLLLPSFSSAQSTIVSKDPNFTPAILKSGLLLPDGVVFRPPTGDLLVTQSGTNQVSSVNPNSGVVHTFASTSTSPDKIAVRASDGLVAVMTGTFGPVAFFSSNGTSQGTVDLGNEIATNYGYLFGEQTFACLSGLAFDTSGNLFVAAGPAGGTSANPSGCQQNNWALYEFAGLLGSPTLSQVTTFGQNVVIQDMAYSAARPPFGTLYAVDSQSNGVYEISLCSDCEIFPSFITNVSGAINPRGIAVDPLLGDLYVTDFDGSSIYKIPAHGGPGEGNPGSTVFASGFSNSGDTNTFNTLRLGFDTLGNLYVNEFNNGNLWKFTRASNATAQLPLIPGVINTFTFTNPNPAMSDQVQTILIPASARLNGAAFIQDIFVSVDHTALDATMANGTTGDTAFFGGAPVPSGTTCLRVPSANPNPLNPTNCVVVVQKCYDINHDPFEICPVQEPSTSPDLIQLSFTFTGSQSVPASTGAFLIGFDNGDGQDITDITIADCCSGGTKSLCSKTFDASLPSPNVDAQFSVALPPGPVNLTSSSPYSEPVTVTSFKNFPITVSLSVVDVPTGFTANLSRSSVPLAALGSDSSTMLTVGISSSTTTSGLTTIISNLLAAGCIDNAGIANAFTSKLSAAQNDIAAGQIKTAINVLMAFRDQVSAQSNKHIASSCTTSFPLLVEGFYNSETRSASTDITYSPAAVIAANVNGLITSLKMSVSSADPITAFVTDSSGNGIPGVTVSILTSPSDMLVAGSNTTPTDMTGFYFFATTSSLAVGSNYTIQVTVPPGYTTVTPANPVFTWTGKGLAFSFVLQ